MNPAMAAALQRDKVTIDPSLRLYIPFNEGAGNVAKDYTQYGNNGVFTDVEWGINGGVFNGTSAYANCGNDSSLDIADAITSETWVKESVRKAGSKIAICRAASFPFYFLGVDNGFPYASVSDGSGHTQIIANSAMSLNEWHHLVMTFNDTTDEIILYVDGVSKTLITIRTYPGDTAKLQIGKAEYAGDPKYFSGTIASVKIYNRTLSALEILTAYEAERGRYGV